MSFSALDRSLHINTLIDTQWDLVIIGGGITGAGILLDAVSRGLKTALIEKNDFASGTSSRSTKLIHGGLRYLKNFEISLVREVGLERAIVHANARHLVRPEPMLLPIYHDGSIGRITGSIGLWFYDWLADVDKTERRRMLSHEETLQQEPSLRRDGLLGSGFYYEYRTDDARLTLSILRKAVELGGLALNYCVVTGFAETDHAISGVYCRDVLTGNEILLKSHVVVNATGPWLDSVLRLQNQVTLADRKLLLSKGVHIVVSKAKLPINQSMYFDAPGDGRMIFCIPRDQAVYIGTTDAVYEGDIDEYQVNADEVEYLLTAVNHIMEGIVITAHDVIGSWAGLRPLIYEAGKSPSELSRKDEIFQSPDGLISIAGGKLTGYRKMAERVTDLVIKRHPDIIQEIPCRTLDIRLAGGEFESEKEMQEMLECLIRDYGHFSKEQITKLFYRYGTDAERILSDAGSAGSHNTDMALTRAEVSFTVREEMAYHLSDHLYRRTSDMYFDQKYLQRIFEGISLAFVEEFGPDTARITAEASEIERFIRRRQE